MEKITTIQKLAWVFAVMFLLVVVMTNIPAFNDARGYNFGLYKIHLIDNVVHLLTFIIGGICAWYSARLSKWFFIFFGILYGLDALTGLFLQRGVLDFSVFTNFGGSPNLGFTNILVNLPHVIIAVAMVWIGVSLSQKIVATN